MLRDHGAAVSLLRFVNSHLARALVVLAAATTLVAAVPGAASAHGDRQRAERFAAQNAADNSGANVPLVASDNVSLLSSNPGSAGISGCFMKTQAAVRDVQPRLDQGLRRQ